MEARIMHGKCPATPYRTRGAKAGLIHTHAVQYKALELGRGRDAARLYRRGTCKYQVNVTIRPKDVTEKEGLLPN